MDTILTVVSGALLLTLATVRDGSAQRVDGHGAADEEAIRRVVASYVEAWNRSDMTAWGALFTEDVDYVNRGGGWWRSNQENVSGHRAIHDALVKRGARPTLRANVASISFLAPHIALVHVETSGPGPASSGEVRQLRGVMTVVMVRRDGGWLIRALQNTLVDPVPIPGQSRPER